MDKAHPEEAMRLIDESLRSTLAAINPERHNVLIVGGTPRPGFNVPDCVLQSAAGLWRQPCRKLPEFILPKTRAR